jgi:hypothetical protein
VLYRALAHHFERFLQVDEERFERTHGYLRRCVQTATYRYLDCGIFANGVARAHCEGCGHDFLIAFSCKLRCLCTFCAAQMRIVAFIVERSSLRRILKNLDSDCQQPEPLAHSPPAEAELVYAPA